VPVTVRVFGPGIVVQGVFEENADRLFLIVAHELREHMTAPDVRKAADATDDLAELVWPLPGDIEGADRAAAGAPMARPSGSLVRV